MIVVFKIVFFIFIIIRNLENVEKEGKVNIGFKFRGYINCYMIVGIRLIWNVRIR